MATFYDRICLTNDYENDGGAIGFQDFRYILTLFSWGKVSAAEVKTFFACTSGTQEAGVQDLLDAMPANLLTILGAVARAEWPERVASLVSCVQQGTYSWCNTEAEFKSILSI